MSDLTAPAVTPEDVAAYRSDGVVCLRQVVSREWLERLGEGLDRNVANPSDRGRTWWRGEGEYAGQRTMVYDAQTWQDVPEYRAFVEESDFAGLMAELMGSTRINFYYDAMFVRSAGVQFRTPFHQDEPYWSVEGFDCCSAWMPLDPVEKRSSLEFVRGSHVWPEKYSKDNFGALTQDERDTIDYDKDHVETDGLVPFPDVEGDRDTFDILSWDMEPGDVAVFNARIIHGGSGLLREDRGLRVFNTQWTGDDVRVIFRPEGMDPDHSDVMTEQGLAPGDRLSGPLYPQVWPR